MHTTPDGPARAGRREWFGLLVLALPALLLSVDLSVLFLAVPHLAQDLRPSSTQQLWIADIYGFMITGFLVTMGTLADRIGHRRLLLIGGACFGIASLLAAYSTGPGMLIAARALLGTAAATLAPSTIALITNMFKDPKERATAVAVWSSCYIGGNVLGPIIGGIMLSWFWWGSVFLLAVPVMLLLLIAGPMVLPEYRNPSSGRLDLFSVALSLLAILPFFYGVKGYARSGWSATVGVTLVAGALFGVLLVFRQRRLDDPLLDFGLLKMRVYRGIVVLLLLIGVVIGGGLLLATIQLQMVAGLSPLAAGLWLVPGGLGTLASITASNRLAQRVRPARLIAGGLLLTAAGFAVLALVPSHGGLPVIVAGLILVNSGVGPAVSLGYNIVAGAAPPEKTGSATALSETCGQFGVAAGIAILGSISTAVYRSLISIPSGVPAGTASTAHESISGAAAVTRQLADPLAGRLVTSAREAFTSGLNLVGVLGAVLFVVFAGLAVLWLREVPITANAGSEGAEETALEHR